MSEPGAAPLPLRRPTIRTVARAADVSTATVSYVLNGRDLVDDKVKISPETRLRVLAAIEEVGYRPNRMARGVRSGRTDQICLALDHLSSPWTQAMIDAVADATRPLGKTTLLLVDQGWQDYLAHAGADGAVILGGRLSGSELSLLASLGEAGVPVVALDYQGEPVGFDTVRKRIEKAQAEAVGLLAGRNERVACLYPGPGCGADHLARFEGYRKALETAGRAVDPRLVKATRSDRYVAYHAAMELLERKDRPTAIFTTSDLAAVSALWAAYRLGLAVPDDLEIVGLGNTPEGRRTDPPLSSVGPESVFSDVANLLVARLQHEREPISRVHYSDWSFYQRGTTR